MKKTIYLISILVLLSACNIRTPEIHGVVLDAETKQPVEGAWITATLEIASKTVQGDVHNSLFVGKTWTDKDGKFVLPSKEFQKPSFPVSFGTRVERLSVSVAAIGKRGGLSLKELREKDSLNIYLKPLTLKNELETEKGGSSEIRWLYEYCLSGRIGLSIPIVEGGCDNKELNLTIAEYERYLEKFKKYGEEGKVEGYSVYLEQMAYLYEKKGDYERAIETLQQTIAFMERHNLQFGKADIEWKIKKLQQKLDKKQR
ncbi:MAG: lipoprotein [Nitrospirae bacterium]|nr:lipoprotein [Nitrospirota bacterium]